MLRIFRGRLARAVIAGTGLVAAGIPAAAQTPHEPRENARYVPPASPARLARPGAPGVSGMRSANGVQVNLDALGQNIPGDAANEPSITVDPSDPRKIAIGWRQFDAISSNFRQAGYAYSRDAGRTWTFPGVLTSGVFRSDPVLVADRAGRFYYYSLVQTLVCDLFTSDDGGQTWSGPVTALGGDKAWVAIDSSGGPGDQNLYFAWDLAGCCGSRTFLRSVDDGASFDGPAQISSTPPEWGANAVGPDGAVYVVGHVDDDVHLAVTRDAYDPLFAPTFSTTVVDLGGTFSGIGSSTARPNPAGLLSMPWVAVDRVSGAVYVLASMNPTGDDPLDVFLARSLDGGATFEPPVRVNADPAIRGAWQWFATLGVAPNGRVDVVWIDTRATLTPNLGRLYYRSSSDGGQTWTDEAILTDEWNSHLGWPQQNKIGDYYHMLSDNVGASLAYAATFNGEQDVYYLRIGDADCNGNGVGDSIDVSTGASADLNADGVPDECECVGDVTGDLIVNLADLGVLLAEFDCAAGCSADLDGDGDVDLSDLGIVLVAFGAVCE